MVSRLIIAALLAAGIPAGASATTVTEYDVKAAFLINFARYTAWPPGVFHDTADPLVICVLGHDPFGRALDDLTAGKAVDGRPLAVRRIPDAKSAGACHVLFIASPDPKLFSDGLPDSGILTVGEAGSRASDRTVINFTMEDGKVRFMVNMQVADREKVRLSSRLLALASSVKK